MLTKEHNSHQAPTCFSRPCKIKMWNAPLKIISVANEMQPNDTQHFFYWFKKYFFCLSRSSKRINLAGHSALRMIFSLILIWNSSSKYHFRYIDSFNRNKNNNRIRKSERIRKWLIILILFIMKYMSLRLS